MPRTARLNVPGGVFHVVSRFVHDSPCLDAPGARSAYLNLLGRASVTTDTSVLAYCLMSNHVHLVLRQGDMPLHRFTKSVNTGFARHVHGQQPTARGPVFADRPRELLVEEDAYLLRLIRYVHNNPVRAGVVRSARHSDWSSHQAYVGMVVPPRWLRISPVLLGFDRDPARAAVRFHDFVDEGRGDPRDPVLSGVADAGEAAAVRRMLGDGHRRSDGVLGSAAFVARVREDGARHPLRLSQRDRTHAAAQREGETARPSVQLVIDAALALLDVDPVELIERPRSTASAAVKRLATFAWVHEYRGKQIELARALQVDTSVVSRHYGRAMAAAAEFDVQAGAVAAWVRERTSGRRQPAQPDGSVRYHVDADV